MTGLPRAAGKAGGDPSPKTAYGILCGIEAAARSKLDRVDLDGLSVAIQGVGKVGYHLCRLLHAAGSSLVVADIDEDRVTRVCDEFGATASPLDDILFEDVDVVSPCALGAVFTKSTIPKLRAKIIAGAANNQLETPADGQRIADRDILYAPDYVINGGGIINVACEYEGRLDDSQVMQLVAKIGPRLAEIFDEAGRSGEPTNVIADREARRLIAAAKA